MPTSTASPSALRWWALVFIVFGGLLLGGRLADLFGARLVSSLGWLVLLAATLGSIHPPHITGTPNIQATAASASTAR